MRRIKIVNLSERKFPSAGIAFRHILKPLKARKKQPRENPEPALNDDYSHSVN